MGFFRRKNKKGKSAPSTRVALEEREGPPRNTSKDVRYDNEDDNNTNMEENPSVQTTDSSQFQHSDARSRITEPTYTATTSGKHPGALPPAAREAAFHGPPRFDWIDIVSYCCMR
jgi:hypothetical protein